MTDPLSPLSCPSPHQYAVVVVEVVVDDPPTIQLTGGLAVKTHWVSVVLHGFAGSGQNCGLSGTHGDEQ